jgi:hypothetical protein
MKDYLHYKLLLFNTMLLQSRLLPQIKCNQEIKINTTTFGSQWGANATVLVQNKFIIT